MSKIDFKKIDFKNITPEQKKQFLVGGGLIIVVGAFIYFATPKSDDKKADDFNIPENTDVKNYNSKTDALNNKRTQQTGQDLGEIYKNDSVKTETLNFSELDKQMAQAQFNSSNQKDEPKTTSNNPPQQSISNSHNVYGDYAMWQSNEPKNSSVGYSSKKNPNKSKQSPSYEEITPTTNYTAPNYSSNNNNNNAFSNNQVQAKLLTTGQAVDGSKLTFVLLEPAKFSGIETKKGQTIQGIVKEENGRLLVNLQSIKINNKVYPINAKLLGDDGIEGLSIGGSGKSKSSKVGETARNVGENVAGNVVGSIPVIGAVLSSAVRSGNRSNGQEPINLSSNIRAIIMIY